MKEYIKARIEYLKSHTCSTSTIQELEGVLLFLQSQEFTESQKRLNNKEAEVLGKLNQQERDYWDQLADSDKD